ncbi:MAG: hypothetical protein BWY72_00295 [Bacteroidetes bacterium ADurb.Bin416]|nr:MAG: hypothetical protein BWY72_00295 [Bacteroidetes bacterium ADurb.Bin416]
MIQIREKQGACLNIIFNNDASVIPLKCFRNGAQDVSTAPYVLLTFHDSHGFKSCNLPDKAANSRNSLLVLFASGCIRIDQEGTVSGTIIGGKGRQNLGGMNRPVENNQDNSGMGIRKV